MTRKEFDRAITDLRFKKREALNQVARFQAEVKETIVAKNRARNELSEEICKLHQQRIMYGEKRRALETEWNGTIREFIRQNEPHTTSNLAEADTLSIVWELRHRGFGGVISRVDDDGGDMICYDLNKEDWNDNA